MWEGGDGGREAGPGRDWPETACVLMSSLRVHQRVRSHTHATIHQRSEREVLLQEPRGPGDAGRASDRRPGNGTPVLAPGLWSLEVT